MLPGRFVVADCAGANSGAGCDGGESGRGLSDGCVDGDGWGADTVTGGVELHPQ